MRQHNARIKVTSRSFSRHPILKQELLSLFPNSFFNPDGLQSGLPHIFEFLNDADGVILGLEQIDSSLLEQLKNLKIIAKYGVGLDNLDVEAAKELDIAVGWTGGVNKRSVSEQALGFMLGLSRNLFFSSFPLKNGKWEKDGGHQLSGSCVGIIGCGHIGTDVIHLLQPYNCRILICDLLDKKGVADTYSVTQVPLSKLLSEADVVSLHVPLTEFTHFMVNEDFLKQMKPTAHLVNNSRGPVVKLDALKMALKKNTIAGAALDVFESEPPDDLEFLALPNLMVTPHIGGNANEAVLAMGRSAITHINDYFTNAAKHR
jgi:phosphoglycerate dehydrogenase-like enzyme